MISKAFFNTILIDCIQINLDMTSLDIEYKFRISMDEIETKLKSFITICEKAMCAANTLKEKLNKLQVKLEPLKNKLIELVRRNQKNLMILYALLFLGGYDIDISIIQQG